MGDPIYKIARHKGTGEFWRIRSDDDGENWIPLEPIEAAPSSAPQHPAGADSTLAPAPAPRTKAAPAPAADSGFADWLERGAELFMGSPVGDLARGIGRGATAEWADEGAAALQRALPALQDPEGMTRVYRGGIDPVLEFHRGEQREAERRSPVLTAAGKMAGATAAATAAAPLVAAPGALATLAGSTIVGGTLGAATGAGASEGDASDRLHAAAEGGATGTVVGAALPAAGMMARSVAQSRPAQWMGELFERGSERARGAAVGGYPGAAGNIARERGLDFVESGFGRGIERVAPSPTIALPLPQAIGGPIEIPIPRSASMFARQLTAARQRAGSAIGEAEQAATEEGLTGSRYAAMSSLRRALEQSRRDPSSLGRAKASEAKALVERADTALPGTHFSGLRGARLTPQELAAAKRSYEDVGFPDPGRPLSDSAAALVNREAASGMRNALRETMGQASPATRAQWDAANEDFAAAIVAENLATKRAAAQGWSDVLSLPTLLASGAGGAAGGTAGALGAGATLAGARRFGVDALANALRSGAATGSSMRGFANATELSGLQVAGPAAFAATEEEIAAQALERALKMRGQSTEATR